MSDYIFLKQFFCMKAINILFITNVNVIDEIKVNELLLPPFSRPVVHLRLRHLTMTTVSLSAVGR